MFRDDTRTRRFTMRVASLGSCLLLLAEGALVTGLCFTGLCFIGLHAEPARALTAQPGVTTGKHGVTVDDMLAMQRISEHEVSADGNLVAFTVRETDVDANRGRTD